MCMCGTPTINGEPGYSWDGKSKSIRPANPPEARIDDSIIFDEPGRCGGIDSHCHHFRLVLGRHANFAVLVRHGGGDERIEMARHLPGVRVLIEAMRNMSTHDRYWTLHTLYHTCDDAADAAREAERGQWQRAAIQKRIKLRRQRGRVRVEIVPEVSNREPVAEVDSIV